MSLAQLVFVGVLTLLSLAGMAIGPYLLEIAPGILARFRARYVAPHPRALSSVSRDHGDAWEPRPRADEQTDRQTDRQTKAETPQTAVSPAVAALQLDRTRRAVIAVLVDSGWKVGEIRAVLKGDNNTISDEIARATNALAEGQPLAQTPIAERPYDPRRYAVHADEG